jgi:beta-galactosidase
MTISSFLAIFINNTMGMTCRNKDLHVAISTGLIRHLLLLFGCYFLIADANGQSAINEPNPRGITSFDENWRFWKGDNAAAKEVSFDDSHWRILTLPHDWSIEGPVNPPPTGDRNTGYFIHGIGWYRKTFVSPDTSKKVVVEFDAIYMNSDVWINGVFLGHKPYGFTGFRYDITEYLKKDATPNVLAVRVDDAAEPAVRSYAGSGIYRHVRLITTNFTQFRLEGGVYITTPKISNEAASVKMDYVIDPYFFTEEQRQAWDKDPWKVKAESKEVILESTVLSPDGKIVASTQSRLTLQSMHKGDSISQLLTVTSPRLWSDSTPVLYQLRSTILFEGRKLDEVLTTFGIRSLTFDKDKGFFINGRSTKLKGVCVHQDAGSFGNAVPLAIWAYRLGILKEMGCNAIRTSHHPFAPEFYDLCDKLGFFVFDEAFDEWTRDWTLNYTENTRGKSTFGYHLYFKQWYETDLRAMLHRDRNHPSVILYSIGNEIPDQLDDDGWKLAKSLVDICHEQDPTRPVTSACDQSFVSSRNGFMDVLDIGGYNYIDRLYKDSTYEPERRRFPGRIFLGTETTHALHNWLGVRDNDYVIGDFIWTGIDYLGETGSLPSRGSRSGLIDIAGGKKAGFYQRAAYWRNDPVLQIFGLSGEQPKNAWSPVPAKIKWNWPADSAITIRASTNCEEVELFLNNRSLGRKPISRNTYFNDWSVKYEPGELTAVGYLKGSKVATSKLITAGGAARLEITPLALPIASNIILFEVTVNDNAGLKVIDAKGSVTIKTDGPCRLIGVDNGELDFAGPYKTDTRNLCEGRLLVAVERTTPTGVIRIMATATGLAGATITDHIR